MPDQEADVPWSSLRLEMFLLAIAIVIAVTAYCLDSRAGCHDWFARAGAIAVLIGGYVGYRSLAKHYNKFFQDVKRGYPLRTSKAQHKIDVAALLVGVGGTLLWAFGDKA